MIGLSELGHVIYRLVKSNLYLDFSLSSIVTDSVSAYEGSLGLLRQKL